MAIMKWDQVNEKLYETGVRDCALYVAGENSEHPGDTAYLAGVAWNGLTGVDENPSGAEASDLYADDAKYLSLISAEEFGLTITAYTYPTEFEQCDGSANLGGVAGAVLGQQERKSFGLCYRTTLGNDTQGNSYGYKLHLVYGCKASPSSKSYSTINDSPEAIEFSWEVDTTPVAVGKINGVDYKPSATIVIDSSQFKDEQQKKKLAKLLDALYGTEATEPYLPSPAAVYTILTTSV